MGRTRIRPDRGFGSNQGDRDQPGVVSAGIPGRKSGEHRWVLRAMWVGSVDWRWRWGIGGAVFVPVPAWRTRRRTVTRSARFRLLLDGAFNLALGGLEKPPGTDDLNASQEADDQASSPEARTRAATIPRGGPGRRRPLGGCRPVRRAADPRTARNPSPLRNRRRPRGTGRHAPREAAVELTATPVDHRYRHRRSGYAGAGRPAGDAGAGCVARREVAEATAPISYAPTVGVSASSPPTTPRSRPSAAELTYNVVGKTPHRRQGVPRRDHTGDFSCRTPHPDGARRPRPDQRSDLPGHRVQPDAGVGDTARQVPRAGGPGDPAPDPDPQRDPLAADRPPVVVPCKHRRRLVRRCR